MTEIVVAVLAVAALVLLLASRYRWRRAERYQPPVDPGPRQEDPRQAVRLRLLAATQALTTSKQLIAKRLRGKMSQRKANELKNRLGTELSVAQTVLAELMLAVRPERATAEEMHEELDEVTPHAVEPEDNVVSIGRPAGDLPAIEDGLCSLCGKLPCRHYPAEEEKGTERRPQCPQCGSYQTKRDDQAKASEPGFGVWSCARCGCPFEWQEDKQA